MSEHEARLEQQIDARVMARLEVDVAYNYAADAEAQSAREGEITREETAKVYSRVYDLGRRAGLDIDPENFDPVAVLVELNGR